MRRLICLLSPVALAGCGSAPAEIPGGCYRLEDGEPLLKVAGRTVTVMAAGEVRQFGIGNWTDQDQGKLEVTPSLLMRQDPDSGSRDGKWLVVSVPTLPTGSLRYRRQGGRDVLFVPIEAYGYAEAARGQAC